MVDSSMAGDPLRWCFHEVPAVIVAPVRLSTL